MTVVAVFGSSRRETASPYYAQAYELGRELARAGHVVLSGGYGGSMGAVSRGAREAGGHVVGVTCDIFDRAAPNEWLSEEVKTASMMDRLQAMILRSDAFVAVRGGIGTLSELTLVWSLVQTRSITKPVILLGGDWRGLVAAFQQYSDLGQSMLDLVTLVDTPAQVVAALAAALSAPLAHPTPPGPPPLG